MVWTIEPIGLNLRNAHITLGNMTLKFIISFLFLFILSSCLFPVYYYKDISNHPRFEHIIGKTLILKKDVFLYQYSDTQSYALQLPNGKNTALPFSVKEYLRDPKNWQNTDTFSKLGQGAAQGYQKHRIVGVVKAGTLLFVDQIKEKQTPYESFMNVIAHINDPQYQNIPVEIYFILNMEKGKVIIPYPNEPELSAMGCEEIPYPNPDIVDYQ